ncbi:Imm32 family immunity protein [Pedobacter panaciterrae]
MDKGLNYKWEEKFEIKTKIKDGAIIISANTEGLMSLANHFLNLVQRTVPSGYHNSLEDGSIELIVQKL